MTKAKLAQFISDYNSQYKEESQFKIRFLELLQDEDCFLRSRLSGHLTASCWVTDNSMQKILLLHHAKLNKWLQPGGHADGNQDLFEVAKKELQEETRLSKYLDVKPFIFDLDIHIIPAKKNIPEHFHFDVRFHFIADKLSDIQKNHESFDLKWINLEEVHEYCANEKSIMRMVEKTRQLNQKNSFA